MFPRHGGSPCPNGFCTVSYWPRSSGRIALTMDMKMDFPRFVKIDVEYNGSSSIQRGVFLAMVERQLHKLHKNISEIVKQPEPVEQPPCVLWPSRLIETTTDSSKINSWVYVLGLKPPAREDAVFEAKFHVKVEEWSCGVASQEEFDQSSCFIKASVEDSSAMMCTLINCTQYTTPKAIHGPKRNAIPVDTSESKKFPERKKNHKQERSSNEPTRSLRQASDVLSALRHDPKYDIDDFKVGYVDRFKSAIQEKPAADWQTDTQHDEFVAEHRIEYFKKCPQNGESEIWWEKKTKTDKFFKTGNSTEL
ncbi:hypothetical protein DL98DRAFT_286587 [Cadophora sp. DSE1049]|nr:hypothetical protein DL98DRAFT_286587 [Cadophora sp. DSE1049]